MSKPGTLMPPVHPGEILREDFMEPLGLSINKLALELRVPATRISEIVHERRRITADTALRLARYFRTNPEFWLNLQNFYDLEVSRHSGTAFEIERQVHPAAPSPRLRRKRESPSQAGSGSAPWLAVARLLPSEAGPALRDRPAVPASGMPPQSGNPDQIGMARGQSSARISGVLISQVSPGSLALSF